MYARRCVPAESGPYRYVLEVALSVSGPRLVAIMKNPSTAGAAQMGGGHTFIMHVHGDMSESTATKLAKEQA